MRRWLIRSGYVLGLLVTAVLLAIIVLRMTTPSPRPSDGWAELTEMPMKRGEVSAAVVGDELVVVGGLKGSIGATSDDVSVYDISDDTWTSGEALPEPRHHAAAAGLQGAVYVAGGARSATDWTPTDTVWQSFPGQKWSEVEAMPQPRQGHDMASLGGRLYVVGGQGPSDDTLIYTPGEGWRVGAALPQGRDHLKVVAWDGRIWALGGRADGVMARVDIYDPEADAWESGPSLPTPMSAMAVGVIDDELHVVGGEIPSAVGGGVLDDHYVLAFGAKRWNDGSAPLLAVHGGGAAVHSKQLIIVGGASRQGAFSVLSWTGVTQSFTP